MLQQPRVSCLSHSTGRELSGRLDPGEVTELLPRPPTPAHVIGASGLRVTVTGRSGAATEPDCLQTQSVGDYSLPVRRALGQIERKSIPGAEV